MAIHTCRTLGRFISQLVLISRLIGIPEHGRTLLLAGRPVIFPVVKQLRIVAQCRQAGVVERTRDGRAF